MYAGKLVFAQQTDHLPLFVNPPKDQYNSSQLHQLEQEETERFLAPPSRLAATVHRPLHMTHKKGLATRACSSTAISLSRIGFLS